MTLSQHGNRLRQGGSSVLAHSGWCSKHLLTTDEFTKFATLMRDLSPFVLLLVDPANRSRRQDPCAAVTRRNLEFALSGHPDAVALFK
jgi:hypothetical protein